MGPEYQSVSEPSALGYGFHWVAEVTAIGVLLRIARRTPFDHKFHRHVQTADVFPIGRGLYCHVTGQPQLRRVT